MRLKIKCPNCKGRNVIKKGRRFGKYGASQIYYCKDCGKKFALRELEYKTYPPQVIINAISYYNLGNTLEKSSKLVNQRFKVKTSKSTVHSWLNEYSEFCTFNLIREGAVKAISNFDGNFIFSKGFKHEGIKYEFRYHKFKLDLLGKNFPTLVNYIKRFEKSCPDQYFNDSERCSQPIFDVKVKAKKKRNLACDMASLAIKAVRENWKRHEVVENFILINDSATIACEVPVWLWEKSVPVGLTGHIDLLQIRNNKVYVLDFKPNASKEKKAPAQLYHYASGLSFRTEIPLSDIRCAWFDQNDYFEFNPKKAKAKLIRRGERNG